MGSAQAVDEEADRVAGLEVGRHDDARLEERFAPPELGQQLGLHAKVLDVLHGTRLLDGHEERERGEQGEEAHEGVLK